jgi:hypothetical protein
MVAIDPPLNTKTISRPLLVPFIVAVGFVALHYEFRTQQILPDALQYCIDAREGTNVYHPHHLGYVSTIRAARWLLRAVGIDADWILAAQIHNLAAIPVLVVSFVVLVFHVTRCAWTATLAPVIFLVQGQVMYLGTQPESYIPSAACVVAGVASFVAIRHAAPRVVVTAVAFTFAILYHQLAVLVTAPFIGVFAVSPKYRRDASLACVIAGGLTLAAYLAAWRTNAPELGFVSYCTSYTHLSDGSWGTAGNVDLAGLRAFADAFAHAVAGAQASIWFLVPIIVGLVAGWRILIRAPDTGSAARQIGWFSAFWIATFSTFVVWWLPSQVKYVVFVMPPVAILCAAALRGSAPRSSVARSVTAASALLVLGVWNFETSVRPQHENSHVPRVIANELSALLTEPGAIGLVDVETGLAIQYDHPEARFLPTLVPRSLAFRGLLDDTLAQGPVDPLATASRVVVLLRELSPHIPSDGGSGDMNRSGYETFLRWVFAVRVDSDGQWSMREFDAVRLECGVAILSIRNERKEIGDATNFFAELDARVAKFETVYSYERFKFRPAPQ